VGARHARDRCSDSVKGTGTIAGMKRITLKALKPERHALLLGLGATLAGWALALALGFAPLWKLLEYKVFDLFSVATAPHASQNPITIVGIDEASATQLNLNWPFPREMHAELIDRLVEAGAAVIAFDVQFSQPSTPEGDQRFAESIAAAGNVVLASSYDYYETAGARVFQRMDPVIAFTQAGATVGWTDMDLSGDGVPRNMALEAQSFWLEAIRALMRVFPEALPGEPGVPPKAMIRYLGPHDTFPIIPYYQVINRDPSIEGVFADAIVLIGRSGGASADINVAQADAFPTPFTLTSGEKTSGVEIHATQIENALLGNMLEPASPRQNLLLLSVAMLLLLPALVWWSPLRSSLVTLVMVGGVVGLAYWMFRDHSVWFAAAAPLAGIGFAFVGTGTGAFVTERRRAGRIRGAFAMYVSGEVVQEMIANPDKLKLGGERREVSVLFSDLAGFTSLSERLEPDQVAQVVNMYLNGMTRVIMASGGTVDK
ncbi:MAG: CHASE2 domain-containing protein, partial [Gammaproteobacteria bacterium]